MSTTRATIIARRRKCHGCGETTRHIRVSPKTLQCCSCFSLRDA